MRLLAINQAIAQRLPSADHAGSLLVVEEGDPAKILQNGFPIEMERPGGNQGEDIEKKKVEVTNLEGNIVLERDEESNNFYVQEGKLNATVISRVTKIAVRNGTFFPANIRIPPGSTVRFDFEVGGHTVTTDTLDPPDENATRIEINNGQGPRDSMPVNSQVSIQVEGNVGTRINYKCGNHPIQMKGTIELISEE